MNEQKALEKIMIKQVNISADMELLKDYGQYIELYKTHMIVKAAAQWKVSENGVVIAEERDYWNKYFLERCSVLDMQMYRATFSGHWVIEFNGFRVSIETKKQADEIWKKVLDWKNGD